MPSLLAIDIALLPPDDVIETAVRLNASLGREGFLGLRLDADHLPHITLTQQFVRAGRLDAVRLRVADTVRRHEPVRIRVPGAGRSGPAVWLTIENTRPLAALHRDLMAALEPLEETAGGAYAFLDGDARPGDLRWVSTFRRKASFAAFSPHITLGHSTRAPAVAPMEFDAARLAVCHLGRFCTCRKIVAEWELARR